MAVLFVSAALHLAWTRSSMAGAQAIAANGDLWSNLGITFWRVSVGFIIAALVSLPFGIFLGANRRAGEFFERVIPVMNTVSSAICANFRHYLVRHFQRYDYFCSLHDCDAIDHYHVWQGTRTVNAQKDQPESAFDPKPYMRSKHLSNYEQQLRRIGNSPMKTASCVRLLRHRCSR